MRAVSGLSGSYEEKLKLLNLPSLKQRRVRGDLIETFKLIHGIENVDSSKFFTRAAGMHSHATRQSTVITDGQSAASLDLVRKPYKLELRGNFFSQRVINPWNSLPWSVKQSHSVNEFKNNYDKL